MPFSTTFITFPVPCIDHIVDLDSGTGVSLNSTGIVHDVIKGRWTDWVLLCTNYDGILRRYEFLSVKLMIIGDTGCFHMPTHWLYLF